MRNKNFSKNRLHHIIVFLVAGVAMVMLLLTPLWAYRWYNLPFLGIQLEPNNVVTLSTGEEWPARNMGAEFRDRLLALNGEPVESTRDIEQFLDENGYQPVRAAFVREDESIYQLEITPIHFPFSDLVSLFIIPYFVGVAFLGIGIWAYSLRSDLRESRTLMLFVSGVSILTSGFLDLSTTRHGVVIWSLALLLTAGGLMTLALVFPRPIAIVRRWPFLRTLPWLLLIPLMPAMLIAILAPPTPHFYITTWQWGYILIIISFILLIGTLTWRIFYSRSSIVRQQSRVIVFGALLAFTPIVLYIGSLALNIEVEFHALVNFPPMVVLPLSITYAILRFRLLDVDRILSRLLAYLLITGVAFGTFYAILSLITYFVQEQVEPNDPIVIAGYLLLLVIGFNPLRALIQRGIDQLFYRAPADYRRSLSDLSRQLVITPNLTQTLSLLEQEMQRALAPERFIVYLYNDDLDQYLPHATQSENAQVYSVDAPLVEYILKSPDPIWLPPGRALPAELDIQDHQHLGGYTFVPLLYESRLIGFLSLGPRRSGEIYTGDDLEFLAAVAGQSTLALENARLFSNLRRTLDQTLEMKNLMDDIFNSVAAGIITTDIKNNITLFNQAAERIFGIPAPKVLGHSLTDALPAFYDTLEPIVVNTLRGAAVTLGVEVTSSSAERGDMFLRLSCSPLRDAHLDTKGATLVLEDLTERRQIEAERERIRQTFGRIVAPRVRDRLLADPSNLHLDGTKQTVTILFADLKGFTPYSEKTPPENVFKNLNAYLSLAAQAILEQEGTLDKFMGDAVLAIWNSPDPQPDHALRAAHAALALVKSSRQAYQANLELPRHLVFRVGITTGQAIIGNVGTSELFNYTAIGDTVNLAQRLQALAQPGQILMEKTTYEIIASHVRATPIKPVMVKGREQAVVAYELKGLAQ